MNHPNVTLGRLDCPDRTSSYWESSVFHLWRWTYRACSALNIHQHRTFVNKNNNNNNKNPPQKKKIIKIKKIQSEDSLRIDWFRLVSSVQDRNRYLFHAMISRKRSSSCAKLDDNSTTSERKKAKRSENRAKGGNAGSHFEFETFPSPHSIFFNRFESILELTAQHNPKHNNE